MPQNKSIIAQGKGFENAHDAFSAPAEPKLWVLTSPHTGDNRQLLTLAAALKQSYAVKSLSFNTLEPVLRLWGGARLSGLQKRHLSTIQPPYPNIIITAGRANEAIGLWLKKMSGNTALLIYVGTPWNPLECFDLVIATPQYQVPERENVLHISLPLHDIETEKLNHAAQQWQTRFSQLPKPFTAVLVGGSSGPYVFSAQAGQRLGELASAHAKQTGGSLLISTSARTPPSVAAAMLQAINVPHYAHHYDGPGKTNPFMAYLALAHDFIVTGDSVSMIAETVATGKPVGLFDLETGARAMQAGMPLVHWFGQNLSSTAFRFGMRLAPSHWTRDLRIVHKMTMQNGLTYWLGDAIPQFTKQPISEVQRAVDRIMALRHKA